MGVIYWSCYPLLGSQKCILVLMAILNLYLTTEKALTKEDVKHIHPNWTKRQLNALSVILANLITYKKFWVRYESRNQANVIPRYNPLNIGHKVMLGVIEKLYEAQLIEVIRGIGKYQQTEDNPARQSEMSLTARGLHRCLKLGITPDNIIQIADEYYCILRKEGKSTKGIDYIDDDYSRHTEQIMRTYHDYLHQQTIKCNGITFDYPKLQRIYRARGNTNKLLYGGRSSGYWMQVKKADRKNITINGKKTVSCDYRSSSINILYLIETGKMLDRGVDGYSVEGIHRDIVKSMVNRMINNKRRTDCTNAFNKYIKESATKDEKTFMQVSPLNSKDIQDAILKHHSKIAKHFYKGPDYGQRIAWVEANVVFEVASQLALMDVPVLTIHDEFIFMKEDEDLVWQSMYSTFHQFKDI